MTEGDMEKGLISVIIPVYNVEQYLRECLDSVLAQTYSSYEVIMIDDGSTDRSGDICDEYAARDTRFRVIHKENGGLSVARNTGFDLSCGEYVYFLDSDDLLEPDALEELLSTMEGSNADFAFFEAITFRDQDPDAAVVQGYFRSREYETLPGIDVFGKLSSNNEFKTAIPTYFWRRSFISSNSLAFLPGVLYEDLIFSFAAFCVAKKAAHCHRTLYRRRLREGSIVTSKPGKRNFESMCTVFNSVVKTAANNNVIARKGVSDYIGRCGMRTVELYSALSPDDKKNCRREYSEFVSNVRSNKGYGSGTLLSRTYGKLPWAAYRGFEKIFLRRKK